MLSLFYDTYIFSIISFYNKFRVYLNSNVIVTKLEDITTIDIRFIPNPKIVKLKLVKQQ
jgi:NADPH-dependent 7-cyano-7-deazaguanine reductase QueF